MERDSEVDPEIDMTAPGSDTDLADGSASQVSYQDMLERHLTDDVLDVGYSPPDRQPSVPIPTPDEERRGESLDERLREEEPDFDLAAADEADDQWDGGVGDPEAGRQRSGRLTSADDRGPEDDVFAADAGIAGGAASAEEAAVHLLDEGADYP